MVVGTPSTTLYSFTAENQLQTLQPSQHCNGNLASPWFENTSHVLFAPILLLQVTTVHSSSSHYAPSIVLSQWLTLSHGTYEAVIIPSKVQMNTLRSREVR